MGVSGWRRRTQGIWDISQGRIAAYAPLPGDAALAEPNPVVVNRVAGGWSRGSRTALAV